ncbi:hypothetical protein KY346_02225 [Candidatus Woesearchaeota archaeon]|nr:hypothetical protein [Candidatus Woesearchaeota archaeon]
MKTIDTVLNKIKAKKEPTDIVEFSDHTFERFADFCMSAGVNAPKEIITEYLAAEYWACNAQVGDEKSYHDKRLRAIRDGLSAITERDFHILQLIYGGIYNGLDERLDNSDPKATLFKGKAGFAVQFAGFDERMCDLYIEQFSSDPVEGVHVEKIDNDGIVMYSDSVDN